jgi:hypothetical protein
MQNYKAHTAGNLLKDDQIAGERIIQSSDFLSD